MPTRRLWSDGPEVSVVGLGLAALGRPAYINLGHRDDLAGDVTPDLLRSRAHAVLDRARSLGITYFDAARSYGAAEQFLGSWLDARGIGSADVTVGSKWGYVYVADWRMDAETHEVKIHTVENLDRQLTETRARLGSHLDLYQIHSATLHSGVLDDDAILDRLARLRATGVALGLSVSGPDQPATIRKALRAERDGRRLFDTVQATWNLLEPSSGPALAEAAEAGLGVIVKEAVANGRLAGRDEAVSDRMGEGDLPTDALAIAAALAQPWSKVVLSGASTTGQLDQNLRALDVSGSDLEGLQELAEAPDEYWQHRAELDWT